GDLPPSSRLLCFRFFAAVAPILRPVVSEPVNDILRTNGWETRGEPTSSPKPVTTFTTPGGNPASSNKRAKSSVDAEVNSDGLMTTVHPAASAGASFHASKSNGEFHGVIIPTTPSGSWRVKVK